MMRVPKYIHLLIDRSGSMRDKDICPSPKIKVLKDIIKNYAIRWQKEDTLPENIFGISTFSSNYTLLGTKHVQSSDFNRLLCSLDSVRAQGSTNLYCSISQCLDDMNNTIEQFSFSGCSILIIMTDGMETEFNCTLEEINYKKNVLFSMGKRIYLPVIGIGKEGKKQLEFLDTISEFRVGADSVEQLYERIMNCIECSVNQYINSCK